MNFCLRTLAITAITIAPVTSLAADFEIKDQLISIVDAYSPSALDDVKTDLAQKCAQWRQGVQQSLQSRLVVAICGVSNISQLKTNDWFWVYGRPSGLEDHPGPVYAFSGSNTTQLVISVEGEIRTIKTQITGNLYNCPMYGTAPCLAARNAALASFEAQCQAWRTDIAAQLGDRFVYASCGSRDDVGGDASISSSDPYFSHIISGTGVAYYTSK